MVVAAFDWLKSLNVFLLKGSIPGNLKSNPKLRRLELKVRFGGSPFRGSRKCGSFSYSTNLAKGFGIEIGMPPRLPKILAVQLKY